jgi:hypothetical protein
VSLPHTLENQIPGGQKSATSDRAGVRRREPSISFLQAFEAGAAGKDDLTVLKIAAEKGCILVSHDVRTMPRYFPEFIHRQASPGLILVPQKLALSAAIEELVLLWIASESSEWVNQICYLPV